MDGGGGGIPGLGDGGHRVHSSVNNMRFGEKTSGKTNRYGTRLVAVGYSYG